MTAESGLYKPVLVIISNSKELLTKYEKAKMVADDSLKITKKAAEAAATCQISCRGPGARSLKGINKSRIGKKLMGLIGAVQRGTKPM